MRDENGSSIKSLAWRILPWMADALCACLLAWATYLNAEIRSIKTDVAAIALWRAATESNRYTALDHKEYSLQVQKEIASINERMGKMQQEWLQIVSDIKVSLAEIKSDLRNHDQRP